MHFMDCATASRNGEVYECKYQAMQQVFPLQRILTISQAAHFDLKWL